VYRVVPEPGDLSILIPYTARIHRETAPIPGTWNTLHDESRRTCRRRCPGRMAAGAGGLAPHAWLYFAVFLGVILAPILEPVPASAVGLLGLAAPVLPWAR
jgi:hypothetical protein